nr:hypothetical protein [Knoellia locipacati]
MAAPALEDDRSAPRQTGEVGGPETEVPDDARERIREPREAEALRHHRRPSHPRLVPGHDGELVGEGVELRPPRAGVQGGAVHEHERRPRADPLVRDLQPVDLDALHA